MYQRQVAAGHNSQAHQAIKPIHCGQTIPGLQAGLFVQQFGFGFPPFFFQPPGFATQQSLRPLRIEPERSFLPSGIYRFGQRAHLAGGDSPCSIPASLQEVTRQLGHLGFPRYTPEGQEEVSREYTSVCRLRRIQDNCNLRSLYRELDKAADAAESCLIGNPSAAQTLQYPSKRVLLVEALERYSVCYYQQAFLAHTLADVHPRGFLCSDVPHFRLFDFTSVVFETFSCPTPLTSSKFIRVEIESLEQQIQRAENERSRLSEVAGVGYTELARPSLLIADLTAEKNLLASLESNLRAKLLLPDLLPFGTCPHPRGWPKALCKSIDGWIVSNDC